MTIELKKFGRILTSRPAGRDAWLAAQAYILRGKKPSEKIRVDFDGVNVLTPSWADEFLSPLFAAYPNQVELIPSKNPTVIAALEFVRK
ncbi:MAG: hypothetical protein A3C90_03165 [Candidatus Magasanikbacteria bacterium RIFCSPHIGHO2_02_FULL_51_14]|uniref:DUF4325 domain-containing protein n=1 Tax=Candidatus Magasanikbacteria bacterium RIFCSPHIGHO2_02_FULL_51_14 TaxID=1798683 RepID=A0A1F6MNV7_9BACT|nr:MAG: hypothetical protein A3C90_03165 [Candidatus Magasanikbacteria bacterium RIFCSPHIGHO2_02_FULL_51_14]